MADRSDLNTEAQKVILQRIIDEGQRGNTQSILRLAEAYAWVHYPNQPHGSGGAGN
jgi:hypothetical protein